MPAEDRLTALLSQTEVTGIDFIQVVDPQVQTLLRVFFLLNPDELASPIVNLMDANVPPETVEIVSISGGERLATVPVVRATYQQVTSNGQLRTVLEVETAEPGDFSIYRLTIRSALDPNEPESRIDRFFNGVEFSFKQGCPSVLDCQPPAPECPPEDLVDFPIDYLARDFVSLRNALLDFAAQRYPKWTEKIEADAGVMLVEIMAALGDEFSYIQDRYAREAYLETATQRRSLRHHTRLIDYAIHDGLSASAFLDLTVANDDAANPIGTGIVVDAGNLVWAPSQGEAPIPFELGAGLRARTESGEETPPQLWVHSAWNSIAVHVPDEGNVCLPVGSTELFVEGTFPEANQLPEGGNPDRFWMGKWVLLETRPEDPAIPVRRHLVRIVEVEPTTDPLCLDESNQPMAITRIRWQEAQALPFEMCLRDTIVRGNLVFATAGETMTEYFSIGSPDISADALPEDISPDRIGVAIERQGPLDEVKCERSPTYLYSLGQTETRGLGWLGELRDARPEIELEEVSAANLQPLSPRKVWRPTATLLDSRGFENDFTLEDGTWRRTIGFRRIGETIVHSDYASGSGFTLCFGDGEFGRIPDVETVFRVRYRTGPGSKANLPADTEFDRIHPITGEESELAEAIASVANPFPITNGIEPEDATVVKQIAPEAFRSLTFRAVRSQDYGEIAERLPWVQRAGARSRWTGSWLSTFVTADPANAFELSPERRTELGNLMDCVRQVGREVFIRNPRYVNLDLEIQVCVEPFAYPGQVQARILEALLGRRGLRPTQGFFHPDRFTFGTPLERSALEASIQAVPGVLGVDRMCIRARGITEWRSFRELTFTVGSDRIIRLRNDPRFPEQGSLRIVPRSGHRVTDLPELSCQEDAT